jgi:hypothetical protein
MGDFKSKFDVLSFSSTFPGDTSSNPSSDDVQLVESPTVETTMVQTVGAGDDLDSPFPVTYFGRQDLPFARSAPEPPRKTSPEAYTADQIEAHSRQCPVQPCVEHVHSSPAFPDQQPLQRPCMYRPAQHPQTMILMMPVLQPPHKASGVPTLAYAPSLHQPNSLPSSSGLLAQAPAQKQPAQKQEPVQKQPTLAEKQPPAISKAASKNEGHVKTGTHSKIGNSPSWLDTMPAEKKDALCKYIYSIMVQKSYTSPDGYLIVDIFTEVWKDMSESSEGSKVAQQRFCELLRSAPQYFTLFRKSIQVANHCGWYARKGERMVRLVLDEEQ